MPLSNILKFPKRKTRLEEIDEALDRIRAERSKAHARWRELDNEVNALWMERYAEIERRKG